MAIAESLIPKIIDELGEVAKKQLEKRVNLVLGVEEGVANIKDMLETIQNVLHDAERRGLKEEPVGKWLEKLEDITCEMDDVLDEWNVCSFILSLCLCLKQLPDRLDIAQKINKINGRLELTLKEADKFKFITSGGIPDSHDFQRGMTTSIIDESKICGRDSDKVALLDQVLSKSSSQGRKGVQVISVVGAGGSGKTTLAQLLFNNDEVQRHFEPRNWICISDPFDQKRVAKAILENAGKSSQESELDPLIQRIKETFSGKRFLLVLDDVWTEDDSKWEPFQNSLKDGAPGSVILVTTRSHRVAAVVGTTHTHQMAVMSDSDCWLIMQRIAFANKSGNLCKKVERIGQKIAEKCKGLPLAAKTMGSLLRFKDTVQQWQNVLDSEIWELEEELSQEQKLFPHLYLSYNELSPEQKRCFSYCAVFPKDHEIYVEELIWLWMAQGYVRPRRRGENLELVGLEYFNSLAMRSFFQELKKVEAYYGLTEYMKCKMHDIVHDFAQFLTKNECHALDGTGRNSSSERPRHLTILEEGTEEEILKCVRTLTLSRCELAEIPAEIGRLIHLRHLDLSHNPFKELPEAMCDLYYLEILCIGLCEKLSMEPPPNLEGLQLHGYPGAQLPSWLVTKSHPNNLTKLVIARPHNISSLLALRKLSSLEELKLVAADELECLGKKFFGSSFPNLRKLHFGKFQNWTNWEDLSEDDEEVVVSIMPCLEELKIWYCRKLETLPHRILKRISSLKKLDIRDCDKLSDRYSDKTGDDWKKISHISQVHISNFWY
ncbi:unnamed protein product [Coffea canephora]|uniref:DH200=94 genomic scaffold, scaffold_383 n=1 Tax=Coffea canephora TaxID=49390 RepID=A0A068VFC0_COFCA|nr:unnamed protein product [Coffea canephora]